uniref:CDP-diacylglycerol--inositol 3-phosphatidyltransferase n=1 Tax=Cyanoderma ruficeps TaxID=181631 RepID=A0A8C3QK04_9PASS
MNWERIWMNWEGFGGKLGGTGMNWEGVSPLSQCYARILLAAVSFWLMPTNPGPALTFYGLAGLLDAVDGHMARLLDQGSRVGAMLDMLTDRLSSLCLLLNLALLQPRWAPLLQLCMALDVASHWLHMHWSTLQGASSHKAVGGEGHPLLRRYYGSRPLLFLLCAGNEIFYGCWYLLNWGEGPPGDGLYWSGLWGRWFCGRWYLLNWGEGPPGEGLLVCTGLYWFILVYTGFDLLYWLYWFILVWAMGAPVSWPLVPAELGRGAAR